MFICDKCKKPSPSRTRQNKVTVKERERTYTNIIIQHIERKWDKRYVYHPLSEEERTDLLKDKGFKVIKEWTTKGKEIVKEINVCDDCYKGGK